MANEREQKITVERKDGGDEKGRGCCDTHGVGRSEKMKISCGNRERNKIN